MVTVIEDLFKLMVDLDMCSYGKIPLLS